MSRAIPPGTPDPGKAAGTPQTLRRARPTSRRGGGLRGVPVRLAGGLLRLPWRMVHSRWLGSVLLAGLWALCGVVFFQLIVMPRIVRLGQEASVPDLRGLPAAEVGPLLEVEGLREGSLTEAYDDHIRSGHVLRHAPPPGFRVKEGRAVELVVSLGPEALQVPDLEGESLVHARFLLMQTGLEVGRVGYVRSAALEANQVVAASPRPGTPLRGRSSVDLLVSRGAPRRPFLMPDLRGADLERAETFLAAVGFEVGRRRWAEEPAGAPVVIDQTPPPGYPIEPGGTVELLAGR